MRRMTRSQGQQGRKVLQTSNEVPNFDTERVVARLKQGGWKEEQAVALCDVLREVTRGLVSADDLKSFEAKMIGRMEGLEAKMDGKMEGLRFLIMGGFTIMGLGFALLGFLIVFKEFLFSG